MRSQKHEENSIHEILEAAKKAAIVPQRTKKHCKRGVLFAIEQEHKLSSLRCLERMLKNCGRLAKPTTEQYWRVRETLREAMARPRPTLLSRWVFNMRMAKSLLAGAVSVCLLMLVLHVSFQTAPQMSAGSVSINIIYGGVAVDGKEGLVKGYNGRAVSEGETLITGKSENSLVELVVFDNAIIRLGDNTSVTLEKIAQNEDVTISLKGMVWVKTFEDESHLKILASDSTMISVPRGAITILSNERITRVLAKENVALVEVVNQENDLIKTQTVRVPQEYVVTIPKSTEGNPEKQFESQKASNLERILGSEAKQWIEENEKHDKVFEDSLEQARKDEMKRYAWPLPGSPLYTAKKIKEGASLSLLPENEKPLAKLEQAATRLQEAVTLFESGDQEHAEELLREYTGMIASIQAEKLYGENAEVLDNAVQEHLISMQKKLSLAVKSETPAYSAKEAVEALLLDNSTQDGDEKAKRKDGIAQEKLYEVLRLLKEGKQIAALILFNDYADMTLESLDLAKKLLRQGEESAVYVMAIEKLEKELPLIDIIAKEEGPLGNKAKELKGAAFASVKEISEWLSKKSEPSATVSGVAQKKQGNQIPSEDAAAFRITGVARK